MSLLNRLERIFGRFAIPNISLWIVVGQVFFWSVSFLGFFDLNRIVMFPAAVLAGEYWRAIAFIFLPPASSPVFIAFAWYLFYLMGGALEHYWGVFRYNLFLFTGWALTVAVSFLTPNYPTYNIFLGASVFLAFAFLNPDFEMMLFFILPVKIKWLALIQWLGYGFYLIVGDWSTRLMILAAVGNFLIFFSRDLVLRGKAGRRRMEHQARQFGARDDAPEPRHTCYACGKTDLTHPQLEFRYCSKCAGEECYCSEHIANHPHTVAAEKKG